MCAFGNDIVGRRRSDRRLNRFIYAYTTKVLMIICVLLINRCGFVRTIETASLLNINGHTKTSASQIRSMILPSSASKQQKPPSPTPPQQQQQPKPSSVIYIPSLDGIIDDLRIFIPFFIFFLLFYLLCSWCSFTLYSNLN